VNHCAHVLLVDSHAKSGSRYHEIDTVLTPSFQKASAIGARRIPVEAGESLKAFRP
jgi:hypothetical protein